MKKFDPNSSLDPGVRLIEASAGTGKTYTITSLYVRLILEVGLQVQQILVVTFTRAATAELRDRIRRRLRETLSGKDEQFPEPTGLAKERLLRAILDIDEASILTINGFCAQILKEHAFEIGSSFDAEFIEDESALNSEITADFWTQQHHLAPEEALERWKSINFKQMAEIAKELGHSTELRVIPDQQPNPIDPAWGGFDLLELDEEEPQALPATVVKFKKDFVAYYREELARRKRLLNRFGHQDTLTGVDDALHGPHAGPLLASLRSRFRAGLIDEFQDTDALQYRIFHRVFGAPDQRLFLIGDPKQAIYSFRGADLHTYLAASRAAVDRSTLQVNHRSDEPLLQAVNQLFSRSNPFLHPEILYHPVEAHHPRRIEREKPQPSFVIHYLESRNREWVGPARKTIWAHMANTIASELRNPPLIDGRPLRAGDIAILIRNNWTADVIQAALQRVGIPSVRRQNTSVLGTDQGTELLEVLEALAAPRQKRRVRSALSSGVFGFDAEKLETLTDEDWDRWLERFDGWLQLWHRSGVMAMLTQLIAEMDAPKRILSWTDGERQLTNWFHLAELLHQSERAGNLGPIPLIEWFRTERREGSSDADSAKIRLETDDAAVQVLTMHTCKGLQFPVVWCPVLWEKDTHRQGDRPVVFHDPKQQDRVMDVGSPWIKQNREKQAEEGHAESLRLAYVALTRAKHECHLVYGAIEGVERSPISWLLHPVGENLREHRQHVKGLSGSAFLDEIREWERTFPDWFSVRPIRRGPPGAAAPTGPSNPEHHFQTTPFQRIFHRKWRVASFSSLTQGSDETVDHDSRVLPIPPSEHPRTRVPLSDFPRGTEAGTFLHKVLELIDFQDRNSLPDCIRSQLILHGIPEDPWSERLPALLQTVLDTPLSSDGWPLSQLSRSQRLDEWEFLLPAAAGLTPSILSSVFLGTHLNDYAGRLASLDFETLSGFLRGFVDLIAVVNGRWYILDYKSNHLGDSPDHYSADRVRNAMLEHHYPLQYHLYALALHRHLKRTLPGYAYDEHFGGIYYLFLRGMDPSRPGYGVFGDRPSMQLIRALETSLAGQP